MLLKPLYRLQLIKKKIKKIKTLKQSDAISPEIELGCGDKKHEKVFIYVFNYLFIF